MVKKGHVIVGLDLGTTKTCAIVAEITDTGIDIIGIGSHPSEGLRKGVVVNIESTVESVKKAVTAAENMSGCSIKSVYAGIAGVHIRGQNSLGIVAVKGREKGVKIYTARRRLQEAEREGWGLHNMGMEEYYVGNFTRAAGYFRDALKVLPGDTAASMLFERSQRYSKAPPPAEWDGVEIMTRK